MEDIIDNQYHRDCFFDSGNENWDWQNLSKKSHNNITNGKELSMQIVIDIDEYKFKEIKRHKEEVGTTLNWFEDVILNGTILPKGHGELIDRDKIEYLKAIHDAKYGHISWIDAIEKIKHSAPTIIEADTKESEE